MLKRILNLFKFMEVILNRKQKALCVLVFLLTCVGAVLECLGVSVIVPLVSVLVDQEALRDNKYIQDISFLREASYHELIVFLCGLVIFVYLIKNIFFIFLSWVRIKFSTKIHRELSIRAMKSWFARGYEFFLGKNYGEFQRAVSSDPSAVYAFLLCLFRLLSAALTIVLIGIYMLHADWLLAITTLLAAVMCLILIYFVFRRSMYKAGLEDRKYTARFNQDLVQMFQAVKDILLYRKQHFFINEYEDDLRKAQSAQCKSTVGGESPAYLIEGICVSGVIIALGIRLLNGISEDFISTLAAFAVGAFRILPSLGKISSAVNGITNAIPSISALYEQIAVSENIGGDDQKIDSRNLLILKKSKTDDDNILQFDKSSIRKIEDNIKSFRELQLKSITFKYSGGHSNILEDLDMSIPKGESVGLIGASGAGKSTLADLILGLLQPQSGCIYINGVRLNSVMENWAHIVGYVPQSIYLSDSSIEENIAFGVPLEQIDQGCLQEAIRKAELEDFVNSIPDGIKTIVGDRGVRLSGGQRQRIAIARALYRKPEIVVLDEATSALDNETEKAIMSAIDSLHGEVTLIIVAHRLTTIRNCDVVYEVKERGVIKRDKREILGNI